MLLELFSAVGRAINLALTKEYIEDKDTMHKLYNDDDLNMLLQSTANSYFSNGSILDFYLQNVCVTAYDGNYAKMKSHRTNLRFSVSKSKSNLQGISLEEFKKAYGSCYLHIFDSTKGLDLVYPFDTPSELSSDHHTYLVNPEEKTVFIMIRDGEHMTSTPDGATYYYDIPIPNELDYDYFINYLHIILSSAPRTPEIDALVKLKHSKAPTLLDEINTTRSIKQTASNTHRRDNIKYCIICGEELPGRAVFCPYCGEKQDYAINNSINANNNTQCHTAQWKRDDSSRIKLQSSDADDYEFNPKTYYLTEKFYLGGYTCPDCGKSMYKTVFPPGKEFQVTAADGTRIELRRTFTCPRCMTFYTATQPRQHLSEGIIYSIHFDNSKDYDSLLDIMNECGSTEGRFD